MQYLEREGFRGDLVWVVSVSSHLTGSVLSRTHRLSYDYDPMTSYKTTHVCTATFMSLPCYYNIYSSTLLPVLSLSLRPILSSQYWRCVLFQTVYQTQDSTSYEDSGNTHGNKPWTENSCAGSTIKTIVWKRHGCAVPRLHSATVAHRNWKRHGCAVPRLHSATVAHRNW